MPIAVTFNGSGYTIPVQGDSYAWGTGTTSYLAAIAAGALSKAGGTFTLTSEVDFGGAFGLKALYLKSPGTVASTGIIRLANASSGVVWRDAANSADLALTVNGANQLTFDGSPIGFGSGSVTSVTVSAGSSKLSSSGSPITTSGVITLDVQEANLTLDNIGGTLSVSKGGSGATTLTGYLKGNGTSAFSTVASIPAADISGTISLTTQVAGILPVVNGGTGAATLTGYIKGAGTSALTASSTIPTSDLSGTINLATQVSGNLSVSNLNSGSGAVGNTYWSGAGTWTAPTTLTDGSLLGATLTLANSLQISGDWGNLATSPYFQGNSGNDTRLRVRANTTSSTTATSGFQAYGSSDPDNCTYMAIRTRGNQSSTTGPDVVWGTVLGGVEQDTALPFRFLARTGGSFTVLATINVGTSSVASTDLVRNSELAAVNPVTTKGDISTFSTVPARLGVSADTKVLVADSATPTGLNWQDPEYHATALESALSTGFTVTIVGQKRTVLLDTVGVVATGTVTMPTSPPNGQLVTVAIASSTGGVTALTVAGAGGATIVTAPTTLMPGGAFTMVYLTATTSWYWV